MPELTDDQLQNIRQRYVAGVSNLLRRIASAHGVGLDCIEAIVHGRPWRHLAGREEPPIRGLFDGEG